MRNGKLLSSPSELVHLDRLGILNFYMINISSLYILIFKNKIVFGASQYYMFIDPSKATPKDTIFTFEMAQDEIAKASGIISNDSKANMTQGCLCSFFNFWAW